MDILESFEACEDEDPVIGLHRLMDMLIEQYETDPELNLTIPETIRLSAAPPGNLCSHMANDESVRTSTCLG